MYADVDWASHSNRLLSNKKNWPIVVLNLQNQSIN